MATRAVFLDTSGLFAWFNSHDPQHGRVVEFLTKTERSLVTTDWVVGESCNLLVARRKPHLVRRVFQVLDESVAISRLPIDESRFQQSRVLFEHFEEHAFPFTDCTSFVVMRELGLQDALTADRHFRIMGFNPLLADK